jgi:CHAT domain-containing protein
VTIGFMQRRQILKAIPFALAGWTSATYAQRPQKEVDRLFDIAATKHKRELRNLWALRGAPLIEIRDASSQSIANTLAVKSDNRDWYGEITYPDKTAVLFYSYEQGSLQVWLVSALGIQAYHKESVSKQSISEAILSLRNSLNVDSLQHTRVPRRRGIQVVPVNRRARAPLDTAITNLTTILLPGSIANALNTVEHLVIVPVLDLGTVPYAILKPFRDNSFLIDKMSVSIAPSLFDLGQALDERIARNFFTSPLIVGNPYLPDSPAWSVPSLPGAKQEAQAVAKMMNAVPLLEKAATKTAVLSRVEESSLLYFATHGVASSQDPLSGGFLMLSAEKFEQGWWTVREIQNTRLNAKIAVLSACQTGLGQAHDAGVIGLSRAFQIAGVPRVVMSLWSVDDQATSDLMQAFVKHIETHIPSQALRLAMLAVRQKYAEPSKWASFVMFGTPR